jgi:hypothetical protein
MTTDVLPLFAAGLVLGVSLAAPPGPVMAIMATASRSAFVFRRRFSEKINVLSGR